MFETEPMKHLTKSMLIQFIIDYNVSTNDKVEMKQLMCLVTTYCMLYDIEVDTREWDKLMCLLYGTMKGDTWDFEKFDNFMAQCLV